MMTGYYPASSAAVVRRVAEVAGALVVEAFVAAEDSWCADVELLLPALQLPEAAPPDAVVTVVPHFEDVEDAVVTTGLFA